MQRYMIGGTGKYCTDIHDRRYSEVLYIDIGYDMHVYTVQRHSIEDLMKYWAELQDRRYSTVINNICRELLCRVQDRRYIEVLYMDTKYDLQVSAVQSTG